MSANSFNPIHRNRFNRKWGTAWDGVDPYITGYFHTYWDNIPPLLVDMVHKGEEYDGNITGMKDKNNIGDVLRGSCIAATIPGKSVNKVEFIGYGGTRWSSPTTVDYDNTLTLRFIEFSTLPILTIISNWVRVIHDCKTGVYRTNNPEDNSAQIFESVNDSYRIRNYTGTLYYWTTQPNGITVEYYACGVGLYPLRDPQEVYGSDISTNDKLEIDVEFNCDYLYRENWVREICVNLSKEYLASGVGGLNPISDSLAIANYGRSLQGLF